LNDRQIRRIDWPTVPLPVTAAWAVRPGSQRSISRSQLSLRLAGPPRAPGRRRPPRAWPAPPPSCRGPCSSARNVLRWASRLAHAGTLERLQLAAECGQLERRIRRRRERHETGGAACCSRISCSSESASGSTQTRRLARTASSSGTQKGSAWIAGRRACSAPRGCARTAAAIHAARRSPPVPRSWPGASTNVGSSWTVESSRTAGAPDGRRAARPRSASPRRSARRRGARRSAATTRASGEASPRLARSPRRRAPRAAGARCRRAGTNTGCPSPASHLDVPRHVVARRSHALTRGSTVMSSSWSRSARSCSASCSIAARPTVPAGPDRARSPACTASTRARGARSAR